MGATHHASKASRVPDGSIKDTKQDGATIAVDLKLHHPPDVTHYHKTSRPADFYIQSQLRGKLPDLLLTETGGLAKMNRALQAIVAARLIDYSTFCDVRDAVRKFVVDLSSEMVSNSGSEDPVLDVFRGECYGAVGDSMIELLEIRKQNASVARQLPVDKSDLVFRAKDALDEVVRGMTRCRIPEHFSLNEYAGCR